MEIPELDKASILIVEDNSIVVLELQERLEELGYKIVTTASSGLDAIKKATFHKPDLILMDIRLKGDMDGIDTSAEIKKNLDIPVIFLTAHADDRTIQRAKLTRPYGYIIKPFEERELKTTLEMALYEHSVNKKLKESEERFRQTFEFASIGNSLTSIDGKFINVNDTLCKMLGYSKEELISSSFAGITHPDDMDISRESLMQLLSGQVESCSFEKRYIKKDGKIVWANVISTLLKDANGNPLHLITHVIDITDRKKAEANNARNEHLLRLFVEHSPASIAMFDLNMHYIMASSRFKLDYELGEIELIGRSHYEVFPDIPARWKEIHQRCLNGETIRADEDTFLRSNGKLDWIRWEICPWYDHESEIGGILLFSEVITEQIKAAETLRQSEERFRKIFEDHSAIKLLIDPENGNIVDANDSAAEFYGWAKAEIKSMNINQINTLPAEEILSEMARFKAREKNRMEFLHRCKDGSLKVVDVFSSKIEISGKAYLHSIVIDITERKRAEEAVRASENKLRNIFDTMSEGVSLNEIVYDYNGEMVDYRILEVNDAFYRIADIRGTQVIGELATDLYGMSSQSIHAFWSAHKSENEPVQIEMISPINKKCFLVSTSPFINDKFITTFSDITERKKIDEALRKSEEGYRSLFKNAPVGIFYTTTGGKISSVNDELARMMGYKSPEDMIETVNELSISELIYQNPSERSDLIEKAIQAPGTWIKTEVKFTKKNGAEIITNLILRTLPGNSENLEGFLEDITVRKHAEEELRESELRFRTLIDQAPVAISVSRNGRCIYANRKLKELFGYHKIEDIIDQPVRSFFAPEYWENSLQHTEYGLLSMPLPAEFEAIGSTADGLPFPMRLEIALIRLSDGEANIAFIYDLTESRQAEHALRESEERYRQLYENSSLGVYRSSTNGQLLLANPAFLSMLGYSTVDELIMEGFEKNNLTNFYDRKKFIALIESAGEVKGLESAWRCADGSIVYIRENARVIKDSEGNPLYYDGIIENITDSKLAEQKLMRSQQLLTLHIERTPLGFIEFDNEGFVRRWNPSAAKIFGYSAKEAIGQAWKFIVPEHQKNLIEDVWFDLINQQGDSRSSNQNITKSGKIIICEWYNTPLVDPAGKTIGIASLIMDITDRIRAENELNEQMDEITRFNKLMVGRESKMIELKKEINELLEKAGKPQKYVITEPGL